MKKLFLPRSYLSWSQLTLWEKDRNAYRDSYYYGKKIASNVYMEYGSKVAKAAEDGDSDDIMIKTVNTLLPTYPKVEHEIRVTTKTEYGQLDFLGKLDTFNPKDLAFRERKTGTRHWTQRRVDSHGQIDFYYMLIYLKHKKLPPDAWLDWAETAFDDNGELKVTGRVEHYPARRTLQDTLRMVGRATRVAKEISDDYKSLLQIK